MVTRATQKATRKPPKLPDFKNQAPAPPPVFNSSIPTSRTTPPSTKRPRYAGLTTAVDIATRQRLANAIHERKMNRSSMRGLTLRTAFQDIREVLVGIPHDYHGRKSMALSTLLFKNDRLRGIGLLAIIIGILALVF